MLEPMRADADPVQEAKGPHQKIVRSGPLCSHRRKAVTTVSDRGTTGPARCSRPVNSMSSIKGISAKPSDALEDVAPHEDGLVAGGNAAESGSKIHQGGDDLGHRARRVEAHIEPPADAGLVEQGRRDGLSRIAGSCVSACRNSRTSQRLAAAPALSWRAPRVAPSVGERGSLMWRDMFGGKRIESGERFDDRAGRIDTPPSTITSSSNPSLAVWASVCPMQRASLRTGMMTAMVIGQKQGRGQRRHGGPFRSSAWCL